MYCHPFICSFTQAITFFDHSFKYLLDIYFMTGTAQGAGDGAVNETVAVLLELILVKGD